MVMLNDLRVIHNSHLYPSMWHCNLLAVNQDRSQGGEYASQISTQVKSVGKIQLLQYPISKCLPADILENRAVLTQELLRQSVEMKDGKCHLSQDDCSLSAVGLTSTLWLEGRQINRSPLKFFWLTVLTNGITMFVLSEASPITNWFNCHYHCGELRNNKYFVRLPIRSMLIDPFEYRCETCSRLRSRLQ